MPVTQVGAIYATVSKLLQRIYIPHADDSEINQQAIAAGETLLLVPIATYQSGGAPAVQALIGTPTFSGRCAVVHPTTKLVLSHIIADPAIYSDPSGNLIIAHDHSIVGDLWTGSVFTRLFVEVDHTTAKIVGTSTQNILTVAPTANALNWMLNASVAPNAITGTTINWLVPKVF
jgi:hypothetical protein